MQTLKLLSGILLLGFSVSTFAAPRVGDAAPNFQLIGSDGNTHSLSEYKGKQSVVIAFFPKAFTGG